MAIAVYHLQELQLVLWWDNVKPMSQIDRGSTAKLFFGILAATAVLLAVAIAAINIHITGSAEENVAASIEAVPSAEVAIILGAQVYDNGTPSPSLADRLDAGVELYKLGKVRKLLLTGDHGRTAYDEVNAMRRYVLARGVRPEDAFMDHAGFNTYESMYRAKEVFGVKKAIVVTQRFHLSRALYIAKALGIDAVGVPADRQRVLASNIVREFFARVKAFLDVNVIRPKPTFLGPKIPITGDGRVTWDERD